MENSNLRFFKNNVDFYSEEYRDYSLKPWESRIVNLATGPEVLDVACGGGRITVPLLRRGHNVTGVDFVGAFEPKIKKHEREFRGKFTFAESGMTDLPFDDGTFNSVVCINSIIYLRSAEEIRRAVREMSRVLKPVGRLYLTSWNLLHPLWGISVAVNYIVGRGKKFGETSPFWATDRRLQNSKTRMFVPSKDVLEQICRNAGINSKAYTGPVFAGGDGLLAKFHPIIVVAGIKEK